MSIIVGFLRFAKVHDSKTQMEVINMARTESKTLSVAPAREQEAIQKHEMFGWTLFSSQEVFSKDSHLEERGGDLWSVTTTTNYVKLVFQRDLEMPQIAEVKNLEKEYWDLYERTKCTPQKSKLFSVVPLVICGLAVLSALFSLFESGLSFGERLISFLSLLAFGALMFGISYAYNRFLFAPKLEKFFDACRRKEAIEKEVQEIVLS